MASRTVFNAFSLASWGESLKDLAKAIISGRRITKTWKIAPMLAIYFLGANAASAFRNWPKTGTCQILAKKASSV